jgi:biopolymer transport protein ExbB
MKNWFNAVVIAVSLLVAALIYTFYFGGASHFEMKDKVKMIPDKSKPIDAIGNIYTGGPLVAILMGLIIISITFVFERQLSIAKARGKSDPAMYVKRVIDNLSKGNYDAALSECEKQRGSLANIMRAAIERFRDVEKDTDFDKEKKMSEVQRAIDEATNLETPLLEKNLVVLSTVASISTMVGLLGTTVGMIRAFAAFGSTGTVDATQLAVGISEALYNTAGGLLAAIISILFFNFFTTKVDNYVYMIDEAILNMTQLFTIRVK